MEICWMRRHTGALWISTMPRSGEVNEWPGKTRAMGDFLLLKQIILGEADMSL